MPIGTTVQPSPVGTVATTVAPKLTGEVRVECGENGIKVIKPTEKSFKGNVYVKGHFDDPKCKIEYENQTDVLLPSISINIHDCGAERKRSVRYLLITDPVLESFELSCFRRIPEVFIFLPLLSLCSIKFSTQKKTLLTTFAVSTWKQISLSRKKLMSGMS